MGEGGTRRVAGIDGRPNFAPEVRRPGGGRAADWGEWGEGRLGWWWWGEGASARKLMEMADQMIECLTVTGELTVLLGHPTTLFC